MIGTSPRLDFILRTILAASVLAAALVFASISAPAQSQPGAGTGAEPLHAPPPAMAMTMPQQHPLYGRVLSLAGFVELTEGDQHPAVWIKAVDEAGRATLYTTAQLESLGYRVEMASERRVILDYGPYRLEVSASGTM